MPTLQIRIDDDEHAALQQLADEEKVSVAEFCRQAIRLGVASDQFAAIHAAAKARRDIDRDEHKKSFNLLTQCTLILHEIAEKQNIDLDAIRGDAVDYTEEHFANGDALEKALQELENVGANAA